MALIKENHVALAGGISNAVRRVKERMHDVGRLIRIEVEVETKDEFLDAVRSGADFIMLDKENFSVNCYDHAARQTEAVDPAVDPHPFRDARRTLTH